jgi:putative flippase GtrA
MMLRWGAVLGLSIALVLGLEVVKRLLTGRSRGASGAWLGRGGLGRNAVAGAVATGVDYAAFYALIELAGVPASPATFLGCVLGAGVNLTLNRVWAFDSHGPLFHMARRYAVVSGLSAAFNALGVAVLLLLPPVGPTLAWLVTRVWVFVALNYPLHRDYVFQRSSA